MTLEDLRKHAAHLVGEMADEDQAEAEAIIEEMAWQVRNVTYRTAKEATAREPIRLVRPVEAR